MAVDAARVARPRRRAAASPRRRVAGGVVWIAVAAVLLTGLVALNVTVLQLNVKLDELGRKRTGLQAENAVLQSQLAAAAAAPRIQARARKEQGVVPADPGLTVYLDLRR
jgi:cell division protein FtsL